MGLIAKLKLLIKTAKPVGQFVNQVKGGKLKWKTIPFWVSLLGSAIALVASLNGVIPLTVAVIATGILTSLYQIIRGLDKADQTGVKPTWKTSEFWLGALSIVSTQIIQMQTAGINSEVLTTITALIAGAMAVAQNIGAQQPEDVKTMNNTQA